MRFDRDCGLSAYSVARTRASYVSAVDAIQGPSSRVSGRGTASRTSITVPPCGSGARHLLYAGLADRSSLCAPGRWTLFRCDGCSSAYLDPRPDERTAHLAYGNYYDGAAARLPAEPGAWRRLRRALRSRYRTRPRLISRKRGACSSGTEHSHIAGARLLRWDHFGSCPNIFASRWPRSRRAAAP
jgi:hypothetical protein